MRSVVTGVAGFIGSTLCEALLKAGHSVVGIDRFNDNYSRSTKEANVSALESDPSFEFVAGNLLTADLDGLLDGADLVFHQAGQPGVRSSWASGFQTYAEDNILATQRLLEAVHRHPSVQRVVYASSSSVYGDSPKWPVSEQDLPHPLSPYGVTKLAAEHLCNLYAENHGVPVVSLRYFTVYGPKQRPDMAINRLIRAALRGEVFTLYGDGSHIRDFTFVRDVVRANLGACEADVPPGTVMNIAGQSGTSMAELITLIEQLTGLGLAIESCPTVPGDVQRTGGSIERAVGLMGWEPVVSLREGLTDQIAWQRRQDAELLDFATAIVP